LLIFLFVVFGVSDLAFGWTGLLKLLWLFRTGLVYYVASLISALKYINSDSFLTYGWSVDSAQNTLEV